MTSRHMKPVLGERLQRIAKRSAADAIEKEQERLERAKTQPDKIRAVRQAVAGFRKETGR